MDGNLSEVARTNTVTVQPLQRIGHFVLLSELGRGGMGTVFAAYDERLDRKAAIKLLHTGNRTSPVHRQRVLREAQAMAQVSHPNVVAVYEVDEVNGLVFIAMEFIDGITLTAWQRQPGRTWQELLGTYLQAGHGLAAAHATGLVHRDFKPDNVLVSRGGRARVLDFGLARRGDGTLTTSDSGDPDMSPRSPDKLTMDGVVSGTPGYMSPEQFLSAPVDARADQFSFCAALFEALFGQPPFAGKVEAEIAGNTLGGHVQPRRPDSPVPEEIHRALLRGLSTNPDDRYPTMDELLAALLLETTDSAAAAASSRKRFVRAALVVGMGLTAAVQAARARSPLQFRQMLVVSAVMLAVTLGAGIIERRSLLRNAFHRRMWILLLVPVVQNFILRLFGWQLGLTYQQVGPLELVVLAGIAALGGAYFFRSMLWVAGMLVIASAAWVIFGQSAAPFVSPSYTIALGWMLLAWSAGKTPPRPAPSQPALGGGEAVDPLHQSTRPGSWPTPRPT